MREPALAPAMLTGGLLKARDLKAFAALGAATLATSDRGFFDPGIRSANLSTWDYLQNYEFSEQVLEGFFRPFFGGVLLDNDLETAAPLFRFYLKKFLLGRCFVPRCGIGDLPAQLWNRVSEEVSLHLRSQAVALEKQGAVPGPARVHRVQVNSDALPADELMPLEGVQAVVLATDENTTAALLEDALPGSTREYHSVSAVYFTSATSLYREPCLVLPSGKERVVRHFCQVTNINPALAPAGRKLISATVLERQDWEDSRLFTECRREIQEVFPEAAGLQPLRVERVPQAVPRQPAPLQQVLKPQTVPALTNVFLAGHGTTHASLDGVMKSGENAARLVLEYLEKTPHGNG
jgi:hypothetical protein